PAPYSGTVLRHRTPAPYSGTVLRYRTPAPYSGTVLRHRPVRCRTLEVALGAETASLLRPIRRAILPREVCIDEPEAHRRRTLSGVLRVPQFTHRCRQ